MKILSLSSIALFLILASGCSTKKEDCSYNGKKVNCSEMPARREEQRPEPKLAPVSLEVVTKGRYQVKNGQLLALSDFNKNASKIIDGVTYSCEIELLKNTIVEIRADERELFFTQEGQVKIFKRTENSVIDMNNLIIGTFEILESVNNNTKIKFIMKFSSTTDLEVKSICSFN